MPNYLETNTYKKFKDKPQDNFPQYIIVHHTGGENGIDTSNQTAKIVEDYHLSLGWEGIGYQFFIQKDGSIWRGRPETYHGAHVKELNMNIKSIGICVAGNFDNSVPTLAQVTSLTSLLKEMSAKYKIKPDSIFAHRHYALNSDGTAYKTCYGSQLGDDWARNLVGETIDKEQIKKQIIELLAKL